MPTVAIQCPQCECYPLTCPGDPVGCVNFKNRPVIAMPKKDKTGLAKDQTHYQQANKQPIEIMQDYMPPEHFIGFLHGNLIKYSLRANYKGNNQVDIDKAKQYAVWLGQALRGEKINPREE